MLKITNILTMLEDSVFIRRLFLFLPGPLRRLLNSQRNFVYALLVHVFFVSIFVVSFDWSAKPAPSTPKVNVIEAVAVDEARVQVELDKLKQAERRRQQQDDARQRKVKKEEQQLAELQQQKEAEQRRLKEQQEKRQAEEKKARALDLKKKAETEKLNKLRDEQAALKKEQQALEKKRKAEQQRLAELEQKRKLELEQEKKRKAEAELKAKQEQQRREAEQALQKKLAAEQQALEAEQRRQSDRVVDQYIEIIRQKVARNWLKPAGARAGLSCTVSVSLIPGGEVLSARVTRGSGDPVFDRSVESAVLKASPLPLPPDGSLFERFREVEFIFTPEG
jgi:colicin import membrane protein